MAISRITRHNVETLVRTTKDHDVKDLGKLVLALADEVEKLEKKLESR